jgi:hypothetical protein
MYETSVSLKNKLECVPIIKQILGRTQKAYFPNSKKLNVSYLLLVLYLGNASPQPQLKQAVGDGLAS